MPIYLTKGECLSHHAVLMSSNLKGQSEMPANSFSKVQRHHSVKFHVFDFVVLKPQATVLKFSEKGIKYPLKILMHKI